MRIIGLLVATFLSTTFAAQHLLQDDLFARYPVRKIFHGHPAPPRLDDADKHAFRTRLRYAAKHGPVFAGHYRIAVWGCGTGCISFAVINEVDGKVGFFPYSISSEGPAERLTFHDNSRALHIVAALNEKDFADRWYLWNGSYFKLLKTTPATDVIDNAGNALD